MYQDHGSGLYYAIMFRQNCNTRTCDSIFNSQAETPTPDIALRYPHLQDISRDLHPLDPSMEILLLIGRYLPEAHHVIDQRLGPSRFPFAEQSPL